MPLKLLKFDIIHPTEYLQRKQQEWTDLEKLSLQEYRDRLIRLRSNYSDFYTYYLNQKGWQAEEYFLLDPVFDRKVARESDFPLKKVALRNRIKKAVKTSLGYAHHFSFMQEIVAHYIRHFQPDVLYPRSQPIPSGFWTKYKQAKLLVARLSARLPHNWHPEHFDLIFTDHPLFQELFEIHGIQSVLNDQGFDERIIGELESREERYPVTFIGGLGTQNFKKRTLFLNEIAGQTDFQWWGYWWKHGGNGRLKDFPALAKTFNGPVSGLDMFQLHKDTAIVLNDYVDTASGLGLNQRMYEVMGVGSLMLTREAPNFDKFPKDIFVTYKDSKDCLDKINYYLKNEKERAEIAQNGQQYVLENYSYKRICEEFGDIVEEAYQRKFGG